MSGFIVKSILVVIIMIVFSSGAQNSYISSKKEKIISIMTQNSVFSEQDAIRKLIKFHSEFPLSCDDVITKEEGIGGPVFISPDTHEVISPTTEVKYTTKCVKMEKNTFKIILTKNWDISVNGTEVISYWIYKVTPNSITLLKKDDKDFLIDTIK